MALAGSAAVVGSQQVTAAYLGSRAMTIAGGTSEITRNTIAERILGSRETRCSRTTEPQSDGDGWLHERDVATCQAPTAEFRAYPLVTERPGRWPSRADGGHVPLRGATFGHLTVALVT